MSTTNNNNLRTGIVAGEGMLQHSDVPCANGTAAFNQGDLVYMGSGIAKALDTDGHAANLIGVALQPSITNSSLDNSSVPAPKSVNVGYAGIFQFKTVSGNTYADGDAVYVVPSTSGGDAQTVTNASGSHAVGCVRLKSGQASIVGGTGVGVNVLVYSLTYATFKL